MGIGIGIARIILLFRYRLNSFFGRRCEMLMEQLLKAFDVILTRQKHQHISRLLLFVYLWIFLSTIISTTKPAYIIVRTVDSKFVG